MKIVLLVAFVAVLAALFVVPVVDAMLRVAGQ